MFWFVTLVLWVPEAADELDEDNDYNGISDDG